MYIPDTAMHHRSVSGTIWSLTIGQCNKHTRGYSFWLQTGTSANPEGEELEGHLEIKASVTGAGAWGCEDIPELSIGPSMPLCPAEHRETRATGLMDQGHSLRAASQTWLHSRTVNVLSNLVYPRNNVNIVKQVLMTN